jgi:type I restriction enzyme S subunit
MPFGDLFISIRNGMNIKQDKSGHGLPITRIETIWAGEIDLARVGYAALGLEDCSQWLLQSGDLLFSHINSAELVGKCAVYRGVPERLVHGMNLLCLRPDPSRLDSNYAQMLIRSIGFRSRLSNFVNKAVNQASVSIGNLRTIPVCAPSVHEQRRIAAILDHADALRQKRRLALQKLDSLTQSIFLDMFGDPINPDGRWETRRLIDLLEKPLRNGLSPSSTGTIQASVLTLSAITGSTFLPRALKEAAFHTEPPSDQTVDERDLLICRGNGNLKLVGRGFFPSSTMTSVLFPDTMIAARISPSAIRRDFLGFIWNSPAVRSQIETLARTTNGTHKVNQAILEGIVLIYPPLTMQEQFSLKVRSIESLRNKAESSLRSMNATFESLQHSAFEARL